MSCCEETDHPAQHIRLSWATLTNTDAQIASEINQTRVSEKKLMKIPFCFIICGLENN